MFLHTVKEGPADRSYGLQVAALAGIPKAVIAEARGRLAALEAESRQQAGDASQCSAQPQLGLLAPEHPALAELRNLDVENLTPKQALDLIYHLKRKLELK